MYIWLRMQNNVLVMLRINYHINHFNNATKKPLLNEKKPYCWWWVTRILLSECYHSFNCVSLLLWIAAQDFVFHVSTSADHFLLVWKHRKAIKPWWSPMSISEAEDLQHFRVPIRLTNSLRELEQEAGEDIFFLAM